MARVALVLLAAAFTWPAWTAAPQWTPDGLYYEAQSHEVAGASAAAARAEVFASPHDGIGSAEAARFRDARWAGYSAQFYRRRWVVPALGAAIRPVAGARALLLVSLLGYVLAGLLVHALARARLGPRTAFAAAVCTLWFPPLRAWAAHPLTDSFGVATVALALAAAHWALRGRPARLAVWAASVALLSFTRDAAVIAVCAALALALVRRTRRTAALAAAGIAGAAPAVLLFGAPIREAMAYVFNGDRVPADTSWTFVARHYLPYARSMLHAELPVGWTSPVVLLLAVLLALLATRRAAGRLRTTSIVAAASVLAATAVLQPASATAVPYGVLLVAALVPLFVGRGDDFLVLARGGAIGAVGYLFMLPEYSDLRLALVLLPFAALGVARAVELARVPVPIPLHAQPTAA